MKNLINKYLNLLLIILLIFFFQKCTSPGDQSAEAIAPVVDTVIIRDMKFNPAETYIASGDKVVFINKDIVAHDVTEVLNHSWTSKPLASDSSWSKTFSESVDYMCTLHPVMRGKIIVR